MATDILERRWDGVWCWGLWPVCSLGKGVGKYLGQQLWFKSSLWLVLGLLGARATVEDWQIYSCWIFLVWGRTVEEGSSRCELRRLDIMLETVISVWVEAVGFGGLEWQLTAALCLCVCLCQMLRPVVWSKNTTALPPSAHSTNPSRQLLTAQSVPHTAPVCLCACVHVSLCMCAS